jgi:hypothetical protein
LAALVGGHVEIHVGVVAEKLHAAVQVPRVERLQIGFGERLQISWVAV